MRQRTCIWWKLSGTKTFKDQTFLSITMTKSSLLFNRYPFQSVTDKVDKNEKREDDDDVIAYAHFDAKLQIYHMA